MRMIMISMILAITTIKIHDNNNGNDENDDGNDDNDRHKDDTDKGIDSGGDDNDNDHHDNAGYKAIVMTMLNMALVSIRITR